MLLRHWQHNKDNSCEAEGEQYTPPYCNPRRFRQKTICVTKVHFTATKVQAGRSLQVRTDRIVNT